MPTSVPSPIPLRAWRRKPSPSGLEAAGDVELADEEVGDTHPGSVAVQEASSVRDAVKPAGRYARVALGRPRAQPTFGRYAAIACDRRCTAGLVSDRGRLPPASHAGWCIGRPFRAGDRHASRKHATPKSLVSTIHAAGIRSAASRSTLWCIIGHGCLTDLFRLLVVVFLVMHGIGHLVWFLAAWTPYSRRCGRRALGSARETSPIRSPLGKVWGAARAPCRRRSSCGRAGAAGRLARAGAAWTFLGIVVSFVAVGPGARQSPGSTGCGASWPTSSCSSSSRCRSAWTSWQPDPRCRALTPSGPAGVGTGYTAQTCRSRGRDRSSARMVALAQPAEHWIVAPEVTGSSPVGHPTI